MRIVSKNTMFLFSKSCQEKIQKVTHSLDTWKCFVLLAVVLRRVFWLAECIEKNSS